MGCRRRKKRRMCRRCRGGGDENIELITRQNWGKSVWEVCHVSDNYNYTKIRQKIMLLCETLYRINLSIKGIQ